eukprot:scaffold195637_cov23-Cyclotella_meneghiniana.AAC.1
MANLAKQEALQMYPVEWQQHNYAVANGKLVSHIQQTHQSERNSSKASHHSNANCTIAGLA